VAELDLASGWTIRRLLVTLELTAATSFHFNHGGALRGLVSRALDVHEVPDGIVPFAPESGRVAYESGDAYALGFTLIGEAQALRSRLLDGLERAGGRHAPRARLAGNFKVRAVEDLPFADVARVTAALASQQALTLRLMSPLRLERPEALKAPRRTFLTGDCFPIDHFLRRLFKRIFKLRFGHYPSAAEEAAWIPAAPLGLCAAETRVLWLDVPIESQPRPGRRKGYTIGGLLGTVTFRDVPEAWRPLIALGHFLHAGESPNYGFGRYRVCAGQLDGDADFRPATTLAERATTPGNFAEALQQLVSRSEAGGLDGETPSDLQAMGPEELASLAQAFLTGRRDPMPLLGFLQPKPDGGVRPLAIPSARDRVAQRALALELAKAIDTILEDCSFAYRKGFSRQGAARAGQDFRLIRYADDFVVVCRDLDAARDAHERARRSLERLGLSLNNDKTSIRSVDAGFTYLGYLFCRSVTLETPARDAEPRELTADAIPAASWLAQVPFERIKSLVTSQARRGRTPAEAVPLVDAGAGASLSRPVYVANPETDLALRDEAIVLSGPGTRQLYPVRSVSHLTLIGCGRATLPLIVKLHELGVPVYVCRRSGELSTAFVPYAPQWPLWLAQARMSQNLAGRLVAARSIVATKLHNAAWLVRRFQLPERQTATADLAELERATDEASTLEEVRGLEGQGATIVFEVFREHLGSEWAFPGRCRQPPTDPVNSMLSLGYTMLYNHVSTAIVSSGLNPRIGLLHEEHGAHHALASDLMEPYRYLVDGLVWGMIKRREVAGSCFQAKGKDGACLMTHDFRRTFIGRFERRLLTVHTPTNRPPETYRETIDRTATQCREFLAGRATGLDLFRAGS
jgi:CRISPR-associated endonuclease Cas1